MYSLAQERLEHGEGVDAWSRSYADSAKSPPQSPACLNTAEVNSV